MDLKIEKYNKAELLAYINSEEFKSAEVFPISPDRALSHINNPRIDENDIILITASHKGNLIGYRTAMADWVFNGSEKIKLAWISGTWITPEYRRQGLANKLFIELRKSWNSNLMYTNYAPASKKLYDKTQVFDTFKQSSGKRFYIKSNAAEIIPSKWSWTRVLKPCLTAFDYLFNLSLLHLLIRRIRRDSSTYNYRDSLSDKQISRLFENCLSRRGKTELDWIMKYPWVIDDAVKEGRINNKYFFSWIAKPYLMYFLIINEASEHEIVFMISIKGKRMTVPYYYYDEEDRKYIGEILFGEAQKNKVSEIDLFDENLAEILAENKAHFIFSKDQERKYMVSSHIIHKFPNSNTVKVPDGEGDVVFV